MQDVNRNPFELFVLGVLKANPAELAQLKARLMNPLDRLFELAQEICRLSSRIHDLEKGMEVDPCLDCEIGTCSEVEQDKTVEDRGRGEADAALDPLTEQLILADYLYEVLCCHVRMRILDRMDEERAKGTVSAVLDACLGQKPICPDFVLAWAILHLEDRDLFAYVQQRGFMLFRCSNVECDGKLQLMTKRAHKEHVDTDARQGPTLVDDVMTWRGPRLRGDGRWN